MKSIIKRTALCLCAIVFTCQLSDAQKKDKKKFKRNHSISINHQGSSADVSEGYWALENDQWGVQLYLSSKEGKKYSLSKGSFFISFYLADRELSMINSTAGTVSF